MDIAEKTLRLKTDFDEVYEAGKKAEYDAFWDAYQGNGSLKSYSGAFSGESWNEKNFKPKYDIIANNAQNMFWCNSMNIDLVEYLDAIGIKLDTSNSLNNSAMFSFSSFTRVGVIDFTKTNSSYSTFSDSTKLKTIDKIIYHDKLALTTAFTRCTALENIIIEGTIGQNGFDIHWSTKLTAESIDSIVRALTTAKSGLTITLPVGAYNRHAERYGASVTEALWAEKRAYWSINELAV
jgi:hypothetical protein